MHAAANHRRCAAGWRERQRALYRHDWVVFAKTPLGGPAQVLEHLSRYTHRTAIGNERIRDVDAHEVAFTVRAHDQGAKRLVRMPGLEFLRRFLLDVLLTGVKRIRHYGLLAAACKTDKLEQARRALQLPWANPRAMESAKDFMARVAKIDVLSCPLCRAGKLHIVQVLAGQQRLRAPGVCTVPPNRGPPQGTRRAGPGTSCTGTGHGARGIAARATGTGPIHGGRGASAASG